MIPIEDNYTLLSLLPYAPNAELLSKHQKIDDLYFIKSVIDFSLTALEAFLLGHLAHFDAQVGENLCQIRAYKVIQLAKKWRSTSSALANLHDILAGLHRYKHQLEGVIYTWENAIKHATAYNKDLDGHEKIIDFLDRHGLLLPLEEDMVFIIACGFLTHFNIRNDNLPVAINLNYISREFHISKYRAKRLTHKYQHLVCELGCQFIAQIAKAMPGHGYEQLASTLYKIADEDRPVLPCYFVSEVIFKHGLQVQVPILWIIRRFQQPQSHLTAVLHIRLNPNEAEDRYIVSSNQSPLDGSCLVVVGDMHYEDESANDFINRLLTHDPLDVILSNTAMHPQYAGVQLAAFRHDPFADLLPEARDEPTRHHEKTLERMKHLAHLLGCCQENQRTFFLRHIYAHTFTDQIKDLQANFGKLTMDVNQQISQGQSHGQ